MITRGYITSETFIDEYADEPVDKTTEYKYDFVGRLIEVTENDNLDSSSAPKVTNYEYDDAGNRTSMTKDGVETTYQFNILNQLVSSIEPIEINGTTANVTHSYTYNTSGDMLTDTEVRPMEDLNEEIHTYPEGFISGNLEQTTVKNFEFDCAGRLVNTNITATVDGTVTSLKDSNGNIIEELNENIELKELQNTGGAYIYNGDGMRVKKAVTITADGYSGEVNVDRKYYYVGDSILFVSDLNKNKTIQNIIDLSGNILMSERYAVDDENNVTNGWFTFNTDVRGSTTNILDSSGFTVTGYVYDEFGNRTETGEEDFLNEATYTGAVYDEEIGLYYMNARYYDCTTGQFISRDTYLGNAYNPWTQNLYTYTGNNPINYTDPTGHFSITLAVKATKVVCGAVSSGVAELMSGGSATDILIASVIGAVSSFFNIDSIIARIAFDAMVGIATDYLTGDIKDNEDLGESILGNTISATVFEFGPKPEKKFGTEALVYSRGMPVKEIDDVIGSSIDSLYYTIPNYIIDTMSEKLVTPAPSSRPSGLSSTSQEMQEIYDSYIGTIYGPLNGKYRWL